MAIVRQSPPDNSTGMPFLFSNGDYQALKIAADKLGFRDEESLLRFALAVLSKSATRTFTIIDQDGKSVALNPTPSLLKDSAAPPAPANH
jgi:hypothetical protein